MAFRAAQSRVWWARTLWWLLRGVLTAVQLVIMILAAVAAARAEHGTNLRALAVLCTLFFGLSVFRLWLGMGLPGLAVKTPGERILLGVQAVALVGFAFAVSGQPNANVGWFPVAIAGVLHVVIKGGHWRIYSPAHQDLAVVRRRSLVAAPFGAVAALWSFVRWFDDWSFGIRLLLAFTTGWIVAGTLLSVAALTRGVQGAVRALPQGPTQADYDLEHLRMERLKERTGTFVAPSVIGGAGEKAMVAGFSRAIFTLLLIPFTFLVGLPLPALYAYLLLRRAPADAPVAEAVVPLDESMSEEGGVGEAAGLADFPKATAVQVFGLGALGALGLFGMVVLIFLRADWLHGAGVVMMLVVSVPLGFVGGTLGAAWGASLAAELGLEHLQALALSASGRLVQAVAERVGVTQRGLSVQELDQLFSGWTRSLVEAGKDRASVIGAGTRVLGWIATRFATRVRESVVEIAGSQGRREVTVMDVEAALRRGAINMATARVGGYASMLRSASQLVYLVLFVASLVVWFLAGARLV